MRYRYSVELQYLDSKTNKATDIDYKYITTMIIDRDYDNNNMPVIYLAATFKKTLLDQMTEDENGVMIVSIYKFDTDSEDNIKTLYIRQRCLYFSGWESNYLADMDYNESVDTDEMTAFVRMYLVPIESVNKNRQLNTGIINNSTVLNVLAKYTSTLGNIIIEPPTYNEVLNQVLIPNTSTISAFLKFINENICAIYSTPMRFFMDFDMAYILSSSGNPIKSKNEPISTIYLDIKNVSEEDVLEDCFKVDKSNNQYKITLSVGEAKLITNKVMKNICNSITTVSSDGSTRTLNITDNANSNLKTKIINVPNNNMNYTSNIQAELKGSLASVVVNKNDMDGEVFTPNKEYIIHNIPNMSKYDGRFLLKQKQEVFVKADDNFVMSCVLRLNKV